MSAQQQNQIELDLDEYFIENSFCFSQIKSGQNPLPKIYKNYKPVYSI